MKGGGADGELGCGYGFLILAVQRRVHMMDGSSVLCPNTTYLTIRSSPD